MMAAHGLTVFNLEQLPTHGGSLGLFVKHAADTSKGVLESVGRLLEVEEEVGLFDLRHV